MTAGNGIGVVTFVPSRPADHVHVRRDTLAVLDDLREVARAALAGTGVFEHGTINVVPNRFLSGYADESKCEALLRETPTVP
jgi:hypothetical protein